jgi:hypothetical protein
MNDIKAGSQSMNHHELGIFEQFLGYGARYYLYTVPVVDDIKQIKSMNHLELGILEECPEVTTSVPECHVNGM